MRRGTTKAKATSDDDEGDDDEGDDDKEKARPSKLKNLVRERDRIAATLDLHDVDASLEDGVSLLTLITRQSGRPERAAQRFATITLPGGQTSAIELRCRIKSPQSPETEQDQSDEGETDSTETPASTRRQRCRSRDGRGERFAKPRQADEAKALADAETPVLLPLGAYGLESPIVDQPTVLFRGATPVDLRRSRCLGIRPIC